MSGLEACQQIHSRYPHLPILILTSREDKSLIPRSINAGAKGYCLKGIPAENLMMAIRSMAAGASWWDATATEVICATVLGDSPPDSSPSLTNREKEILQLLQQGKSNQEIAQQLYISPGTVRVHVHAILQKAGTSDRHRALLWAQQHHLI
jgi:two-component system NarL family response regulator